MTPTRIGSLIVSCVVLAGLRAHADEAGYQRHKEKAKALADKGDYPGAIREYKNAYGEDPKPGPLFNMGLLYREMAGARDGTTLRRYGTMPSAGNLLARGAPAGSASGRISAI